ncbi:hypothetical protein BDR04DRAFT_1123597 [Suillus decipiens]|nr:hypothetical protein BDR04DRAFT_1123597 [Suillus decipiens]
MCLTYDHAGDDTQIASGTCDRHVQVWSFNFKGLLIPIFSVKLSTTIPCMVNFKHSASRNLLVFGMYDGEVHTLWGTNGVIIATYNAGPMIGHTAVDASHMLFLIDNVMNGPSLHQLDDGACIWTYNTDPVKTFPKQVIFGEKTTLVVGGSDTGIIYVFNKNEETLKQELQHADKAQVQTVAIASKTYDGTHHSIIFRATSVNDAEPNISIWSQQRKSVTMPTSNHLGSAFKNFICGIFQLAVAMALMAYISTVMQFMGQRITSGISLESLREFWRKPVAQVHELTNDDIHVLVETYIED